MRSPARPFFIVDDELLGTQNVDDELVYYRQIVAELCDKCQVFDEWFLHLQDQVARNGEAESVPVILSWG